MNNSEEIQELPLLTYSYKTNTLLKKNFYESYLKRCFDFCLALVTLPFILPILMILMFMIKLSSTGPAIYKSERIGKDGRKFKIYKLRTMWSDASERLQTLLNSDAGLRTEWEKNQKLKKDPRITWVGKILRTLSLDELPQIFNILKGEMSFVGPRPIFENQIDKYGSDFREYQKVLPGLTGLWQVSGRNNLSYQARVELDQVYIKNLGLRNDLKILFRTFGVVLFRTGAY